MRSANTTTACQDCGCLIEQKNRGRLRKRCVECARIANSVSARERWRRLVDCGRCTGCGKKKERAGARCATCNARKIAYQATVRSKRAANRQCLWCAGDIEHELDGSLCATCRSKRNEASRYRRALNKARLSTNS
jgi:hypothetical protein